MAIFTRTAVSNEIDSYKAGRALADSLKQRSPCTPNALLLYATPPHSNRLLVKGIHDVLGPGVFVSGGTAQGFYESSDLYEGGLVAAAFTLGSDEPAHPCHATTVLAEDIESDPKTKGQKAAQEILNSLGDKPKVAIVVFDPGVIHVLDKFLKPVAQAIDGPLLGGGAGHELDISIDYTSQFIEKKQTSKGVSILAYRGPFETHVKACCGSTESGIEFTVTRSDGIRILELDNKPVHEVIDNILGEARTLVDFAHISLEIPGYSYLLSSTRRVVAALQLDEKLGLQVTIPLEEGTRLRLCMRNEDTWFEEIDAIIKSIQSEIMDKPIKGILGFECGAISNFLGREKALESHQMLQTALGRNIPWLSLLAWGEVLPAKQASSVIYNYTYPMIFFTDLK